MMNSFSPKKRRHNPLTQSSATKQQPAQEMDSDYPSHIPQSLTHGQIINLQRTLGNAYLNRRLSRNSAPVIQRRGENPYAQGGSHDGWDLTAHHIIAHTKLVEALNSLDKSQRDEVLKKAIPDQLDATMLDNVKVKIPEGMETDKKYLSAVRTYIATGGGVNHVKARLYGINTEEKTVGGAKITDIREAFFEWQAGNQFQGPNTSIRPEPSSSKDDIDRDGKYFVEDYDELEAEGEKLYSLLGQGNSRERKQKVQKVLEDILAITVNKKAARFDPEDWQEVTDSDDLETLVKDTHLDRGHLRGYAFYKIPSGDLLAESNPEMNKYGYLKKTGDSQAPLKYGGIPVPNSREANGHMFININSAADLKPTGDSQTTVLQAFKEMGWIDKNATGAQTVTLENKDVIAGRNQFRIKGGVYTGTIDYASESVVNPQKKSYTFTEEQLAQSLSKKTVFSSLDEFLQGWTLTSTYVPKELYNEIVRLREERELALTEQ